MKNVIATGGTALALVLGTSLWGGVASVSDMAELSAAPMGVAFAQDDAAGVDTSSVIEMTMGDPDAKVKVVEYASYTCPHCATFHANQFKQLKADYIDIGKVHFTYREVYFDQFGLWAGMVARCGGPERFFGIADMLYDQQRDWIGDGRDPVAIADRLRTIGKVAGLSEEELESCLSDNDKAKAMVAVFQENAKADGIDSTPTVLINGEALDRASYANIKETIDGLLAE